MIFAGNGEIGGNLDLLGALRSFVRVVDTGSFSAVAREDAASQSTITRQIGQLEDHFGVRLLHRTTRRLSLTHDGQDLLVHARHLLETADGMEAALGRQSSAPVGQVRFGTSIAFGLFLTPRLPVLFARHPNLSVELVMRDRPSDMIEERLDIATQAGSPPDSSVIARQLGTYGRIAVAAPAYLARRGEPDRPEALVQHECLLHARSPDAAAWTFAGADGPIAVAVSGSFSANDSAAVHRAALSDMGIAMLPEIQVSDDVRHGRLVEVLRDWAPPRSPAFIVYPSRRNLAPRTRAVIDFVVEQVRHLQPKDGA
jgi:DNA-binding transcriptional LysR family regulator